MSATFLQYQDSSSLLLGLMAYVLLYPIFSGLEVRLIDKSMQMNNVNENSSAFRTVPIRKPQAFAPNGTENVNLIPLHSAYEFSKVPDSKSTTNLRSDGDSVLSRPLKFLDTFSSYGGGNKTLSVCVYMSPNEFYEEFPNFQKLNAATGFYVQKSVRRGMALMSLPEPAVKIPEIKSEPSFFVPQVVRLSALFIN